MGDSFKTDSAVFFPIGDLALIIFNLLSDI